MVVRPSKAFVIGDAVHGLTVVVTSPPMILHYSIDQLNSSKINEMADDVQDVSRKTMAAIARELTTIFRGVNLDDLEGALDYIAKQDPKDPNRSPFDPIKNLLVEYDISANVGRKIYQGQNVTDVDFCLAMSLDLDSPALTSRGRSLDPALQIVDYIQNPTGECLIKEPFHIDKLNVAVLEPLPPVNPLKSTP